MIGHTLVDSANQVRAAHIVVRELEIAFGIGFGARRFFHAVRQLDQNDFIAGSGLVGGLIRNRACQGLRRSVRA